MSYLKGLEELEQEYVKQKQEESKKVKQSVKQTKKEAFKPFVQSPNSLDDIPAKNIETSGRLIGKRIRGNKTSLLLQLSRYALKTAVELGDVSNQEFREFYDFMRELYDKEMV
jgi:hypothetical protein